jgi:sialic acid synthase SpsE
MIGVKQEQYLRKIPKIKLLYCISKYPTMNEDVDFERMLYYDGFSDHTQGIEASKKAIDNDVSIIERHFTLGKYLPGRDHFLSSTPDEFKELVDYKNYKNKIKQFKTRWKG